jgi:pilus assembly protein CpaF
MARFDIPYEAIKKQIGSAVHILVQQSRLPNGRRVLSEISEIVQVPDLTVAPIFTYVPDVDQFVATGLRPTNWHRRQLQFVPTNASDPFEGVEEISIQDMQGE